MIGNAKSTIKLESTQLSCDFLGFACVAQLFNIIESKDPNTRMDVDFSHLTWLESGLCSPLGAIWNHFGGARCNYIFSDEPLRSHLRRNGFHRFINETALHSKYKNQVMFSSFDSYDEEQIGEYLSSQLLGKEMPEMSNQAKQKLLTSIVEVFDNAFTHSEITGNVCVCGQLYPKMHLLSLTITDLGIGVRTSVGRKLRNGLTTKQAIEWAIIEGNSTRSSNGPIGIGLSDIIKFLELNNGSICILTNDGIWNKNGPEQPSFRQIKQNFHGTVVHFKIRTDDTNSYYLRKEVR